MFTQMYHKQVRDVILSCLCLLTLLLAACRSASSTIDIKGEIEPEPIVGEIVTLRIEASSEKYSGDSEISIQMLGEGINFVDSGSEWQRTMATNETGTQVQEIFRWHGHIEANEPQVQEALICVTQPGNWTIHFVVGIQDSVSGISDVAVSDLHVLSTVDSAEVIPSSEYEVRQPPLGSTPIPTPEPVAVSAECSGER